MYPGSWRDAEILCLTSTFCEKKNSKRMRVETMKATESDIKRNERDYKAEPCVA
jgi:hypothetical protein